MYYELYIDVFFVENFMMDFLLLLLTGRLMRRQIKKGRIFLGASAASLLTCLIIASPVPGGILKMILFHGLVNVFMLMAGLGLRTGRDFFRAWILLYLGSFLMGGILNFFRPYIRNAALFFFLAVFSYFLLSRIWDLMVSVSRQKEFECTAVASFRGRKQELHALIDSGNTLRDEKTGKPVHIIGRNTAGKLWGDEPVGRVRYVGYHSVGKENGVMPLLEIDRLEIYRTHGKTTRPFIIDQPEVAVCSEEKVTERYDIILNLDI